MPKLTLPGEKPVIQQGGIGIRSGANAVLGAKGSGDALIGLGNSMIQEGAAFAEKANEALGDAFAQDAYTKASEEFDTFALKRASQQTDAQGNPTFATLTSDIDAEGQRISDKFGGGLTGSAKQKFDNDFGGHRTTRRNQGTTQARQQQISFTKASLFNYGIQKLKQATTDSPDNIGVYTQDYNKAIDSAVRTGALTFEHGAKLKEEFRDQATTGNFSVQITRDPYAAKFVLDSRTADQLNISELDKQKLDKQANAEISSLERKNDLQRRERDNIDKQGREHALTRLKIGIAEGRFDKTDIVKAHDDKTITDKQYEQVLTEYQSKNKKDVAAAELSSRMLSDVSDGKILQGAYTPKQIGSEYNRIKSNIQTTNGKPATPHDLAVVAMAFKGPVTPFVKEMEGIVAGGSPDEAVEAASAIALVEDKNPLAVQTLSDKSRRVMAIINANKITSKSSADVVRQAREAVTNLDANRRDVLTSQFKKEINTKNSKGKVDGMSKLIDSEFGEGLNQSQKAVLSNIIQQEYVETDGDLGAAIESAKSITKATIGESDINGSGVTMLFPPEKTIVSPTGTQYASDEIRQVLDQDLQALAVDNPNFPTDAVIKTAPDALDVVEAPGQFLPTATDSSIASTVFAGTTQQPRSSEQFQLESDVDLTGNSANFVEGEGANPAYFITYKDENGNKQILQDKNGMPVKFQFDAEDHQFLADEEIARTDQIAADTTEARERSEIIAGQPIDSTGRRETGASGSLSDVMSRIGKIESDNNYNAVNKSTGALGKYQILPSNLPSWSKAAIGREVSSREFLDSPDLQEKIAKHRLGIYVDKYGAEGAAAAWHSGERGAKNLGPNGRAYVKKFNALGNEGSSGEGSISVANKPQAQVTLAAKNIASTQNFEVSSRFKGQFKSRPRAAGNPVKEIILHDTAGGSVSGAVSTLKSRGLAYHYLIDRDGKILNLVDDSKVAFHAKGANQGSIGISFVGTGKAPATATQQAAAMQLVGKLKTKYPSLAGVRGHKDVSPGRKSDPRGVDISEFSKLVK